MIREADVADARAIARVHVASWRATYHDLLPADFLASLTESGYEDRWRRFISDRSSRIYVAQDRSNEVVGFASGGRERAGETGYAGELYAIYLFESSQRRGLGRQLVRAVVGGLREMGLEDMIIWVLRDNRPARDFYEHLGGIYVRTQPITIGSATLEEVSYGWRRLDDVRY
ncbi:MAG TPA: GNAT family N-acetyltransferase [Candidatus Dormibacteraeota bacterium]|jgi:ribosomal protein S18 acetylase RimI-like enzyme